jgi:hypothetical protein
MTTNYKPPENYPKGGLFDPDVILSIPLSLYVNSGKFGTNSEAWVWLFLRVCLYTVVGFDEADQIVQDVQITQPDFNHFHTVAR